MFCLDSDPDQGDSEYTVDPECGKYITTVSVCDNGEFCVGNLRAVVYIDGAK